MSLKIFSKFKYEEREKKHNIFFWNKKKSRLISFRYVLSYAPGGERGLRFMAYLLKGFCIPKSSPVLPI